MNLISTSLLNKVSVLRAGFGKMHEFGTESDRQESDRRSEEMNSQGKDSACLFLSMLRGV